MQITNLNKEDILAKAQEVFPDSFIELDTIDLFLRDQEKGKGTIEGIDHPVFISTHYAYEDHLINNNKTRYKIHLSIIYIKNDAYEVIYDSREMCYVAYQENEIKFILYKDFYDFMKPKIHIEEDQKTI